MNIVISTIIPKGIWTYRSDEKQTRMVLDRFVSKQKSGEKHENVYFRLQQTVFSLAPFQTNPKTPPIFFFISMYF